MIISFYHPKRGKHSQCDILICYLSFSIFCYPELSKRTKAVCLDDSEILSEPLSEISNDTDEDSPKVVQQLSKGQLSKETIVQGTVVQGAIVQGDSCPRRLLSKDDFCPRGLLSKETFFQGDSYINYCPRK